MHKAPDIAQFVKTRLRAVLPDFAVQYKRRDILRMRGAVVQWIFVDVKRGGSIGVSPSVSVLGPHVHLRDSGHCRNRDGTFNGDGLIVSVGLSGISASASRRWHFPPETRLDETFASEILTRLSQNSPISFTAPLEDDAIDKALRWFGKDAYWLAHLFLAYFNMIRGAPTARRDLTQAFKLFIKNSRYSTDKPPFDYEEALHACFQELGARLDRPDCISLCRADAEEHAKWLSLPAIEWPSEWPKSVLPWPKEPLGLIATLGGLIRRRTPE